MTVAPEVSIDTIGVLDRRLVVACPTITPDYRMALTLLFGVMAGRPLRPRPSFDGCGFMAETCSCTNRCEAMA